MELNNREIAVLLWMTALFTWGLSKRMVRQSGAGVVRAFLSPKILVPLAVATAYVWLCVALLSELGLWYSSNLKTTLLWGVTFALATMIEIGRISEDEAYFGKTARETLSATVLVVFVAEFYSFSLAVELLFVPFVVWLAGMHAMAGTRSEWNRVQTLTGCIIAFVGLGPLVFSVTRAASDVRVATLGSIFATAREFGVPVLLSLMFLPFVFALSIVVTYELLSIRLDYAIEDKKLRRFAKWRVPFAFGSNLVLARRAARQLTLERPESRVAVLAVLREVKRAGEAERNPPPVAVEQGWSPHVAKDYLSALDLGTGDYHRSGDEWFASSPYREIDEEPMPDNLAYYVEGDEAIATRLKLVLNVNNPKTPDSAEAAFREGAVALAKAALGPETDELVGILVAAREGSTTFRFAEIVLATDRWSGGIPDGYTRRFVLERKV